MSLSSRFFFCLLLSCAAIVTSASANPQIVFKGVSETHIQGLQKLIKMPDKEPLAYRKLDQAIDSLMATGEYKSVRIFKNSSGEIIIDGIRNETIEEITFLGNKSVSKNKLLSTIGFKSKVPFDDRWVADSLAKIGQLYESLGYFSAKISTGKTADLIDGNKKLSIEIEEGARTILKRINFLSENQELNALLSSNLHRYEFSNYSIQLEKELQSRVKELLQKWNYLDARVEEFKPQWSSDRTSVDILVRIKNPFRFELSYVGNRARGDIELSRVVDLKSYRGLEIDILPDLVNRLRQDYLDLGYAHIQIEPTEAIKNFKRKVTLRIFEGSKVRIGQIRVRGSLSRAPSYYEEYIRSNGSKIIQANLFHRQDLESVMKNLIIDLQNQGYFRARLGLIKIEYSNDKSVAKMDIVLEEGPLTFVRDISFRGIQAFTPSEIINQISLKPAQPLKLSNLEAAIERINELYKEAGFIEMKILNESENLVIYDESGTQASIDFQIKEGAKVYISNIQIDGNTFTEDFVILREMGIEVGDLLTPSKVSSATSNLTKLGIFGSVEIGTLEANTAISQRTLLVRVTERNPGLVRVGLGANSEGRLTVRSYLALSYNNLFGTAREISARVDFQSNVRGANFLERRVSLGYLEPFLFGTRTRGRLNLSQSLFVDDNNPVPDGGTGKLLSLKQTNSVTLLIERTLFANNKLLWTVWSLDSNEAFSKPSLPSLRSRQQVALIGPTVLFEYRDNPLAPTRGQFGQMSFLYSDPSFGSSPQIQFYKSEVMGSHYLRMMGSTKWLFVNSLKGGLLENLNRRTGSGVPASHAFFLGGASTIRGYGGGADYDNTIPKKEDINSLDPERFVTSNSLIVREKSQYYLIKSELRFPLVGENLGGVAFYDGGAVLIKGYDFKKPYRHSAGGGLRYNTPVGPFIIDLGIKLNPTRLRNGELEDKFRVHILFGNSF